METLRLMVKSVVVIMIIAAFLEIILPRSDMKRYINLIIGMFVIIAVLNPFLAMFHQGFSFDVLETVEPDGASDTGALIQKGREMAAAQKSGAARQYKEKLARQVASLAGLYQNSRISAVTVNMVEDSSQPDFGTVKKIIIQMSSQNTKNTIAPKDYRAGGSEEIKVDEINIDSGLPHKNLSSNTPTDRVVSGLREMIANFYGLAPEQIEIQQ